MKTPKFWYKDKTIFKNFLLPFTYIWLLGNFLNRLLTKPIKFDVPIICVGNLIAGGGGKTPITIKLAEFLITKGYKTHIIKKQYKSKNKEKVIFVDKNSDPSIVGDEALLTAKVTSTWLAKNRSIGIQKAIDNGADLVMLDDGLQDHSIIKDFNIITIKDSQKFGNNCIIPAGPLRESIQKGIEKADHIFYYGKKDNLKFIYQKKNIPITLVKTQYHKRRILQKIKNKKVLAFTGIAHPENFFSSTIRYGLNLVKKIEFSDHYRYTRNDIKKIILISKNSKLSVVTTEKDYVKIPKDLRCKIFSIPLQIKFNERKFYQQFLLKVNQND